MRDHTDPVKLSADLHEILNIFLSDSDPARTLASNTTKMSLSIGFLKLRCGVAVKYGMNGFNVDAPSGLTWYSRLLTPKTGHYRV